MLGVLGRRAVEAAISLFAVLGFCYVPLGQHTALEHAQAVFSTPPAKRAGLELIEAFQHVRRTLSDQLQVLGTRPLALPGAIPRHPGEQPAPLHFQGRAQPKPSPPHLDPTRAF